MSSLLQSRWAPNPRNEGSRPPPGERASAPDELARFMKIVARLKWKLPFLATGYRLATQQLASGATDHAQIMFKLDFHEYYALLERAIVHLLGVFGVEVSAAPKTLTWSASHRYHANVLDALEEESCPLRPVLGTGLRYRQLKKAKELRNRWKTADLSRDERAVDGIWSLGREEVVMRPLESYDLETILADIFDGLEDAYRLAEERVAQKGALDSVQSVAGASHVDWGFIVDAMDWEAV